MLQFSKQFTLRIPKKKKKLETNDLVYFTFLYNFMRALYKPKKCVYHKKYYNKIVSIYFT